MSTTDEDQTGRKIQTARKGEGEEGRAGKKDGFPDGPPESPAPAELQSPEQDQPLQPQPVHAESPKVDPQPVVEEPSLPSPRRPSRRPVAAPPPSEPVPPQPPAGAYSWPS